MSKDILYPLRRLHGMLYEWRLYHRERRMLKAYHMKGIREAFRKNPRSVILVFTPEHENLGDHAIAFAEAKLLNELGIGYYEITGRQLNELEKHNLLGVMNGYPILVQGGGNLGTLWYGVEQIFRGIITNNPRSKIILHPNTLYYEDSDWGREEFEKSKEIYNSHDHLYLYAREETSFHAMKNVYRNVKLIPDVVLSLNECSGKEIREGCLICLRSDREKTRSEAEEACVLEQVREIFNDQFSYTDMCVDHGIPIEQRVCELEAKFAEFRRAELVVTDRLHGMIFAAITGTPCVVINSMSPKVKGCYQWIKDLEYIHFADRAEDIAAIYRSIPKIAHKYDCSKLAHYYDELKADIEKILEG